MELFFAHCYKNEICITNNTENTNKYTRHNTFIDIFMR